MKNISKRILFFAAAIVMLAACETDRPEFMVSDDEAAIAFQNTFASQYLLTEATETNVAERFIWNEPNFGAEVNISYELYASNNAIFDSAALVTPTSETNVAVTVAQMLDFAEAQGLDNDPSTTDSLGNPNNSGRVYFWVTATTGSGGGGNAETIRSDSAALNIVWVEAVPTGVCGPIYIVGDGSQAGWDWASPVVLSCDEDVFSAKVQLNNTGAFRFFTEEGNWNSGLNYPYYVGEGYTIDAELEDAMDGDNNFSFTGTPGIYVITVDDNAQTITLTPSGPIYLVGDATQAGWSWDTPVVGTEVSPDVYEATVTLSSAGAFRFFTEDGNWDSGQNYPYFEDAGYTIDAEFENAMDGDSNFSFTGTDGEYTVRVDNVNLVIDIVEN